MLDSHKRIGGAFLVGVFLVAGAFYISRGNDVPNEANMAGISPVQRTFIAVEDTDNNGVPNWQDALLTNEPIVLQTASSTYEEPTTVTGKFALKFFQNYVRAKTNDIFGDSNEELVAKATQELAGQVVDELLTEKDIVIFPLSDSATLQAYGNQVARVILAHPRKGESETLILQDAVRNDKPERLAELEAIELSYTTIVKQLLETPVPDTYVKTHLDLVNAINAVKEDIRAMRLVNDDPMYTLLRLKRYEDDVVGMSNALSNLFNLLYSRDTVRFTPGDPTLELIEFPS